MSASAAAYSSVRRLHTEERAGRRFQRQQNALVQMTQLAHPQPGKASVRGFLPGSWAVLSQKDEQGRERPIAFAARVLRPNEHRWSATELRAFAVVWLLKTFRTSAEALQHSSEWTIVRYCGVVTKQVNLQESHAGSCDYRNVRFTCSIVQAAAMQCRTHIPGVRRRALLSPPYDGACPLCAPVRDSERCQLAGDSSRLLQQGVGS